MDVVALYGLHFLGFHPGRRDSRTTLVRDFCVSMYSAHTIQKGRYGVKGKKQKRKSHKGSKSQLHPSSVGFGVWLRDWQSLIAPLTDAIQLHKMVESFTFISIRLATPPRLVQPYAYIPSMHLLTSGVFFFLLRPSSSRKHVNRQSNRTLPFDARYKTWNLFVFLFSKTSSSFSFFWVSNKKEREREEHFEDNTNKMPSRSFLSTLSAFFQQNE